MRIEMRVIVSLLFCAGGAWAAEPGEKIGPLALTTLDDRLLTMSNYHEREGTAVVFLSARGVADDNLNCVGNRNCWLAGITA